MKLWARIAWVGLSGCVAVGCPSDEPPLKGSRPTMQTSSNDDSADGTVTDEPRSVGVGNTGGSSTTRRPDRDPKPPTRRPEWDDPPEEDPPQLPPPPSSRDLTRAAYSLRRQGHLVEAAAAFERLLEGMPRNDLKPFLAKELAELYEVMGEREKALLLYRRNHDYPNEFKLLFEMGRANEALAVARLVKYSLGEAKALVALGQPEEALTILRSKGHQRELAEQLDRMGRFADAAAVYGQLQDFSAQAEALERAGARREARRAYEEAQIAQENALRRTVIPNLQQAQGALSNAPDGITRERVRLELARRLQIASESYERLGTIYSKVGEAEKSTRALTAALRSTERQRDLLLDNGGDVYGQQRVQRLQLDGRIRDLQALMN